MDNPTGKSLSEFVKEAEDKGLQIILLGTGAETGKHAALIERLKLTDKILIVPIQDLPEEDQKTIESLPLKPLPKPESFKIENIRLPEIETYIDPNPKPWHENLPRHKKLKGYQKGRKR